MLCGECPDFVLRLQELFQHEKGRKRLSVPPSPGRHRQTAPDEGKVSIIIIMQLHYNTHYTSKGIYSLQYVASQHVVAVCMG